MSTVYNKEDLLNHLQQIIPSGYSMNQDGQFLRRDDNNNRTIMLSFGIRDRFPFGVNFFALGAGVTFHQVEGILNTIYLNHPNLEWGHDVDSDTFYRDFSDRVLGRQFVIDNVDDVTVENDVTFAQVRPYLQQMLDAALNFLNTHQTLQQFYDFAETMPVNDMASFYIQPLPARRIIVSKLLNVPYDAMATALINKYTQNSRNIDAAFAQDLKNHLDNL